MVSRFKNRICGSGYRLRIQIRVWNSDPDLDELKTAPKNSKKEEISSLTSSPEIWGLLLEPKSPFQEFTRTFMAFFCSIFVFLFMNINILKFKSGFSNVSESKFSSMPLSKTLIEIQFHYSFLLPGEKNICRGSKKLKLSKMQYLLRL
jgi:hypothetical protein